jgi:hypothetical protein
VLGLDVRGVVGRGFGLAAGIMTFKKSGTALSLDGGAEPMGVELRLTSVPLIVFWHIRTGPVSLDLGAGVAYHDFEETWAGNGGPAVAGTTGGLLVSASIAYELAPRLSITGTFRYLDISTDRPSLLAGAVNLGGFQVLVGASWTFVR